MSFNIEEYLNSLPLYTEKIDVSNKRLTYIPDLSRFVKLTSFDCSLNLLTELPPINDTLLHLYCEHNNLEHLPPLNEKLISLVCGHNKLTQLPPLNKFLINLHCEINQLTTLPPLGPYILTLKCYENQLTTLPKLNYNLLVLDCHSNNITHLPHLNKHLQKLNCSDNLLTMLPQINEELIGINCYSNDLYGYPTKPNHVNCQIPEYYRISYSKKIYKILYNFRFTFYTIKLKSKFKKWLWERVREPKIMAKFHPDHLNSLKETDDLEEFLEEWVK